MTLAVSKPKTPRAPPRSGDQLQPAALTRLEPHGGSRRDVEPPCRPCRVHGRSRARGWSSVEMVVGCPPGPGGRTSIGDHQRDGSIPSLRVMSPGAGEGYRPGIMVGVSWLGGGNGCARGDRGRAGGTGVRAESFLHIARPRPASKEAPRGAGETPRQGVHHLLGRSRDVNFRPFGPRDQAPGRVAMSPRLPAGRPNLMARALGGGWRHVGGPAGPLPRPGTGRASRAASVSPHHDAVRPSSAVFDRDLADAHVAVLDRVMEQRRVDRCRRSRRLLAQMGHLERMDDVGDLCRAPCQPDRKGAGPTQRRARGPILMSAATVQRMGSSDRTSFASRPPGMSPSTWTFLGSSRNAFLTSGPPVKHLPRRACKSGPPRDRPSRAPSDHSLR